MPYSAGIVDALQGMVKQRLLREAVARQQAQQEFENQARMREFDVRSQERQDVMSQAALNQKNLEQEREYRRASNLAATVLPGVSTADAYKQLEGAGFSGVVNREAATNLPAGDPGLPGATSALQILPERYTSVGGSQYQMARAAAGERAAQATAAQTAATERAREGHEAAAERAREAGELRRDIAGQSQGIAREGLELRRQIAEDRINTKRDERDVKLAEGARGRADVVDLVREIRNHPSLSTNIGPIASRMPTVRPGSVEFESKVNQLRSMLSLEGRQKLRGSGTISDFEAKILAQAATALSAAGDEAGFKRELDKIVSTMSRPTAGSVGGSAPKVTIKSITEIK